MYSTFLNRGKVGSRSFSEFVSCRDQVLAYADDVNLIGDDIRTLERNAYMLLNACKDIGLAVNTGKTKNMEIERHRGIIANEHIRTGSNSYEKVKTLNT